MSLGNFFCFTIVAGSFVAEQTILNQGKSRADIDSE